MQSLYLSKGHNIVFNVRTSNWLRVFIVICDHYGDSGIILPNAVDEIFEFVIAQKGLGGNGNQSSNVVLLSKKQ